MIKNKITDIKLIIVKKIRVVGWISLPVCRFILHAVQSPVFQMSSNQSSATTKWHSKFHSHVIRIRYSFIQFYPKTFNTYGIFWSLKNRIMSWQIRYFRQNLLKIWNVLNRHREEFFRDIINDSMKSSSKQDWCN